MKEFEEIIAREGKVFPGNVLKVDSFLNHQLDVQLIDKLGEAFYEKFKNKGVTKILTIESSGIAIACAAARFFKVPVVFAKKSQSLNLGTDNYVSRISSYTYGKEYDVIVSRDFLGPEDKILLIDDFLAIGNAMKGLLEICEQAGSEVVGIGICIEKAFQRGGDDLRKMGYDVSSLAIIDSMSTEPQNIRFRAVRQ